MTMRLNIKNGKENIAIDTLSRVSNSELNALMVSTISIDLMEKNQEDFGGG